jgi:NAD(P)-dependent dehydrogenase (short-subunit alcohol dehydrogenase family)
MERDRLTDPLDCFRLDDKVVVLTGASSGLGVGFANALAKLGAHLVLGARREEQLELVAKDVRRHGGVVIIKRTDVSSEADCHDLAQAAVSKFGRIDVLVNNAGVGQAGNAIREDSQVFQDTIAINLTGVYFMARACAPHMPEGASIVNVASVLGLVASHLPQAAYVASKAGVVGLTRDLAHQWSGRRGIRVNALCPGYFESEITAGDGAEALRAKIAEHSILGRFGEQAELDSALVFLASPASGYVTGTTLVVDGGLSVTW